ncbi:MAG TPA: DegT/DnrJ/EryC1/StrS family aminotransferase [Cyclobacteriaceae bacterium]|nr:DegT/DnrJ/EryC1/StrS family aminotransferase [Cyclobacteriaceae bacterium]
MSGFMPVRIYYFFIFAALNVEIMPGSELFGIEERKEINDVMETGILFRYNHEAQRNNIWKARDFETEVRKITGAQYAHAVSSGSTAVSCALAGAGIGSGDEVIVPPFTYIASVEAVLFSGGIPVFAEIDETLCLSAEGIRKAVTPKTKAIMLVHMCGQMARMDEIMAVVKEFNLTLIEDCGQAFGSFYRGTSVGLFGKTGCYSFDFFKIATAGEGGVLVTNSEESYKLADSYSDHGHDHIGSARGMEQHPVLGFNYRISELHAGIGAAQTRKVPQIKTANRKNKQLLTELLKDVPGVSFAEIPDPSGDSATFLNLLLPDTDTAKLVVDAFAKDGISGYNYWFINMYHFINQWNHLKDLKSAAPLPIHHYNKSQDYNSLPLPKSQEVVGRLISFGIRCTWKESEIVELAGKIRKSIEKTLAVKTYA